MEAGGVTSSHDHLYFMQGPVRGTSYIRIERRLAYMNWWCPVSDVARQFVSEQRGWYHVRNHVKKTRPH